MAVFFKTHTTSSGSWTRIASESTVCRATIKLDNRGGTIRVNGLPASGVALAANEQITLNRVDLYDIETEGHGTIWYTFAETRI